MLPINEIAAHFKGSFVSAPELIAQKLAKVKAFVFDWDGVFNGGWKDEAGTSPFNEVDAMGTNLLRFNHYLRNSTQAIAAVVTGENNKAALAFAKRECFHAIYSSVKFKALALDHLSETFGIRDEEVAFVFDDVLDFSVSKRVGLRIMVGRNANPLLVEWAVKNNCVDYITANDGAHHALREAVELLTGLSGKYDETIAERAQFTERYQQYLTNRNETTPQLFTAKDGTIRSLATD